MHSLRPGHAFKTTKLMQKVPEKKRLQQPLKLLAKWLFKTVFHEERN